MGILDALLNMPSFALIAFIAGVICLVVEMFIPGFGVAGGSGILLLFIGIVLTAESFAQGMVMAAILIVILAVILTIVLYSAYRGRLSEKLILKESTDAASGFSGTEDLNCLLGSSGTSITVLRPSGTAEIDGVRLDVVTRGEYIRAGTSIKVIEVEGNRIVVAKW
ncbi:MAG: hypothetical protein E7463_12230 [Ruminococcaceae bacterium]|nr:hypothetical protein [Oscillospiraceae bacterium]